MFTGLAAKLGLDIVFGKLKGIPWQVWLGIAVVIFSGLGYCAHQRAANNAIEAAYERGRTDEKKDWEAELASVRQEAQEWKAKYETASQKLTEAERKAHEEELRANSLAADALRLRGPGKAGLSARSCIGAGLPISASGPGQPAPDEDAPGPGMPEGDRAIVSWSWLVQRAREHDDLLSEVETWRSWHFKQDELVKKSKLELPDVEF